MHTAQHKGLTTLCLICFNLGQCELQKHTWIAENCKLIHYRYATCGPRSSKPTTSDSLIPPVSREECSLRLVSPVLPFCHQLP